MAGRDGWLILWSDTWQAVYNIYACRYAMRRTRSHNFTIYSVDVDTRSHNWFGVAARGNCDTDCTAARGHWHAEIPGDNGGVEAEMNFYCFHHFHRYHSTWLLYHYRSCTHRHEERIPHTTHDPGLGSEDVTLHCQLQQGKSEEARVRAADGWSGSLIIYSIYTPATSIKQGGVKCAVHCFCFEEKKLRVKIIIMISIVSISIIHRHQNNDSLYWTSKVLNNVLNCIFQDSGHKVAHLLAGCWVFAAVTLWWQ